MGGSDSDIKANLSSTGAVNSSGTELGKIQRCRYLGIEKKLGLSCAILRIVELRIEDDKIMGLIGNLDEKHER